jgi:cell division protein FtsL
MATAHKAQKTTPLSEFVRSPSLPVLLTVSALAIALAALLPLVQSSDATTTNGNIQLLQQEKADWQARLHALELEIATLGSLDRIEREAITRLHMKAPEQTHYITVNVPAPEPRRLPSRFLPQQTEQQESGSSVWDKLFGWLPGP